MNFSNMVEYFSVLRLALVVVTVVGIGFDSLGGAGHSADSLAFALAAVLSSTRTPWRSLWIVGEGRIPKKSWAFAGRSVD
ncbi:hypothetical protein ACLK19_27460 [Escherichia coli]